MLPPYTHRHQLLAYETARRAAELIPALPRPLFGHPRFRLVLDQNAACVHLGPISRDHIAHRPQAFLRRPPRYHLEGVITCLDREGKPHGQIDSLPYALHCVAHVHDVSGLAALPPVLATLSCAVPAALLCGHPPTTLPMVLNFYGFPP